MVKTGDTIVINDGKHVCYAKVEEVVEEKDEYCLIRGRFL